MFVAANVKIGVSGGEMGMTWRLPRLIGESRATELLLTGRKMGAAEALAAGLVTAVVPADQLADAASGLAEQVMATSPFSTWMTKSSSTRTRARARSGTRSRTRTAPRCCATTRVTSPKR